MDSTLGFQSMYVKIMQLNLNWWQVMCVQKFLTFCFIVTVIRVQMLCSQQSLFITKPIVTMFEFCHTYSGRSTEAYIQNFAS